MDIEIESQYRSNRPPSARKAHDAHRAVPFRYLADRGLKVTSERLAIVDAILGTPGHFEADVLLERLQKGNIQVSRATLYRTLNHLLKAEMVRRITGSDGNPRYESMTGREHHDHMVCLGCSEILEFTDEQIERVATRCLSAPRVHDDGSHSADRRVIAADCQPDEGTNRECSRL